VFTILHLSDSHFGAPGVLEEQGNITEALALAIRRDRLQPDICVFSGDLTFSGQRPQFEQGESWLRQILRDMGNPDTFIVPGNHDVNRTSTTNTLLKQAAKSAHYYNKFREKINLNHLDTFREWFDQAHLPTKGNWNSPFFFSYSKTDTDTTIQILGLNSAVLSCDENDEGNLVIDLTEIAKKWVISNERLVIAIAHHPLVALAKWNRDEVGRLLSKKIGAHLLLHGHTHEQFGATPNSAGQGFCILGAGAAYQSSKWPKYFGFYTIDLTKRQLHTRAYSFSENSNEWILDPRKSNSIPLALPATDTTGSKARPAHQSVHSRSRYHDTKTSQISSNRLDEYRGAEQMRLHLELQAQRYRDAAREIAPSVLAYFNDTKEFRNTCYAVKHRIKKVLRIIDKTLEHMTDDSTFGPGSLVDICGFRLVTFYQSEIPIVIEHLLHAVASHGDSRSPFQRGRPVEITVNTSRVEEDPLSITPAIRTLAEQAGPHVKVEVKPKSTGYSSVHFIATCSAPLDAGISTEMMVEIQVRSVLEDVWGELDHRLRYGSQRGGIGTVWGRHLNVLKAMLDGVIQYVDLIKRHSDEDVRTDLSEAPDKTIETPSAQLDRLQGLPPTIRSRLDEAYTLWKLVDTTRGYGLDVGLMRRAVDAFSNILVEFRNEPRENSELADQLEYVCRAERAYLLTFSEVSEDLAEAAAIYEQILEKDRNNGTACFRLGKILIRQGNYTRAIDLLYKAIEIMESGKDERLNSRHWAYDSAFLNLGFAHWRTFHNINLSKCERAQELATAVSLSRSVLSRSTDPRERFRALNNCLYYAWEERLYDFVEIQVGDDEFRRWCEQMESEIETLGSDEYYHFDTLARASYSVGRQQVALKAALRVVEILERLVEAKVPLESLPRDRRTYAWTIALCRHLDDDQTDSFVFAQDILNQLDGEHSTQA
jgi:ppGpp synthetase/RelA/SpoT-type nucleotidyltranferase/tetratricopeptide (TPR) repeat protein/predicted MPP superfamily phosphohydrolase